MVVLAGIAQWIALSEAPGATWFVQRAVIATVFTMVWWGTAGRDRASAVGGSITLAFVLLTYAHFLGPMGLPDPSLRLLGPDSPSATSHWLSWTDEWMVAFPLTLVAALVVYLAASTRHAGGWTPVGLPRRHLLLATCAAVLVVSTAVAAAVEGGPDDHIADVTALGEPTLDGAAIDGGADGDLELVVQDRNPRVTPLPPHDRVELRASLTASTGERYEIEALKPLVAEPSGRFTTWGGVGYDKWNHGRSGIGSGDRPSARSEVAVFALGEVKRDGKVLARDVIVHAFTLDDGGVELHVGDAGAPIAGLPNGQLVAAWPDRTGASPEGHQRAHNALGTVVLGALVLLVIAALRRDRRAEGRP